MLFRRKKCVIDTRVRQLVTYYMHTTQAKTKPTYDCTKFKYSYLTNASLNVHRLLSSRPESTFRMPPLMQIYVPSKYLSLLYFIKSAYLLHAVVDKDISLLNFRTGVNQALKVISNALCTQNYEVLDGMVTERTLTILKHRVDRLTPDQRNFLDLTNKPYNLSPMFIALNRIKGKDETIIKIGIRGIITMEQNFFTQITWDPQFIYVFQRKYINGIAGAWIVRFINYYV
ncbi:PREDICTED: uncharacterized protein LOC108548026 [Eufriesea mexicana]|uniref:uncharacterized protein LOC108546840 n=1 Tax=Eufriesea mexicana TaxID=516756 RepID=UPI00083BCE40|nr:PREDICTED: uncharacterized protein LOC108546840 [Eufriesea mexicana]XP_017756281.1 PREDICTED: uncharacterized protein LOC108548026 [Eufriesea mexicana]